MKITIDAEPKDIKELIIALYPFEIQDDSYWDKAEQFLQEQKTTESA